MIILHAGQMDDRLTLWAEAPPNGRRATGKVRAPKAGPKSHPYDAGFDAVAALFAEVGFEEPLPKARRAAATVWLPTRAAEPFASSPLVADPPGGRAKITIAPWTITSVPLDAGELVRLVASFGESGRPAVGVVVGHDLAFWALAVRFAGSLVARQQYLPALVAQKDSHYARWEPVFAGEDKARVESLAKRMPAAARALTASGESVAPERPPAECLESFVAALVDHLVREALHAPAAVVATAVRKKTSRAVPSAAPESVHDRWLRALQVPDAEVTGETAELERIVTQVREWRRPVDVAAHSPFRLCFRLEEPRPQEARNGHNQGKPNGQRRGRGRQPARGGNWYVRYLLQATDDPSLLVPARDAWTARGRRAAFMRRRGFDSREYFLAALGQAAGLSPQIAQSLRTASPSGYALDASGAHQFLIDTAPGLAQAGFGVMLPNWWSEKGTRRRLAVRANVRTPKPVSGADLSLETIVDFKWEVAIGDQRVTQRELETLAKLKEPLVKLRGEWVETTPEEIQSALAFWRNEGGQVRVREIVQMALSAGNLAGEIHFEGVDADGWVGRLLEQLEGGAKLQKLPTPKGFEGELRPYQMRGFAWMVFLRRWALGACLADDMGLGKTIQALALVQREWMLGERRPWLLVCPTSVLGNWQHEAARFTPDLPVMVHHGAQRLKGEAFEAAAKEHSIVVTSYALLHRDVLSVGRLPWSGIVLDEAQNIKNPDTKQAKAARSLRADSRIAMTGTPVENHVGDLWSILEFLNPGLLGSQAEFKRTFFIPIQAYRDQAAAKRLQRITGPFVLRRLKTDKSIIADLPEKLEMKVYCTLTKEQGSLYAAVVKDAEKSLEKTEGIARKGQILAMLSKLKQVCNHPAHFLGDGSKVSGRSGKLARLEEMLEELVEVGDRALVFSQFAEMGELLRRHIQETLGREVLFLHGRVPRAKRDAMVDRFQNETGPDAPPIFVLSLKAGGTGLNLTRANHVFHFDRWWNPAVENQATDRAFRIGQEQNVQVHKFVCAGTLEETIDDMIERKQNLAENIVGTGEGWLTKLSNEELREIVALRQDAIRD